ncbi:MAG: hypothetical protein NTZ53_08345 [Cyanobacteria bacterium]|nr:hypothetical protein [Cyanobacteriota bacterium]
MAEPDLGLAKAMNALGSGIKSTNEGASGPRLNQAIAEPALKPITAKNKPTNGSVRSIQQNEYKQNPNQIHTGPWNFSEDNARVN